ncbi:MAG: group II intron reverse transcriptase/maturase [Planctomycetota bacterium]|jgi:RNA-directed DNA polymerase|nr:group II intron reverse transcriptase/maturase [Planctomycetota bacterium]
MTRSFAIPKELVWEAYKQVKANKGGAGVDEESVEMFESKLGDNLYKLWNRMSSGSYFPPPVRGVPIPKKSGGVRMLGVPTVADRVAQTAVKMMLEPLVEPIFHGDSYGYRPGRSALDAVGLVRKRCWKYDWVIEYDIKGLFDNIDHDLLMKAVRKHCQCPWATLYIERWLKAPMEMEDGKLVERDKGTPQGGVVSPLLANIFLHYALDAWLVREHPGTAFCRYADDGVIHCRNREQAEQVMREVGERLLQCKLEMHPEKSRIVYCRDSNRRGDYPNIEFVFLGYSFRPRQAKGRDGRIFMSFLPAVSRASLKVMRQKVRSWRLQLRTGQTLDMLSKKYNPVLMGWANYYGRFYGTALNLLWQSVNKCLVRWLMRKHKLLAEHKTRAGETLERMARNNERAFVHWQMGIVY